MSNYNNCDRSTFSSLNPAVSPLQILQQRMLGSAADQFPQKAAQRALHAGIGSLAAVDATLQQGAGRVPFPARW